MNDFQNNFDDFISLDDDVTNMPKPKESDKYKTRIQKWLTEDGYKVEIKPDLNAQFHLSTVNQSGYHMGIICDNNSTDKIILVSGANLSDVQNLNCSK